MTDPSGSNFILRTAAKAAGILPMRLRLALYRLGPLSRWLRGILNRASPTGETEILVAAGAGAGLRLRLNLKSEKDYWLGSYEPDLQQACLFFVQPGMVVYDIGANIGYLSLLFARQAGNEGHVVAFEALPANLARLAAHVDLNGMAQKITIVSAAVVDSPGQVDFLVHKSHGMGKAAGSAGRDEPYSESISVVAISIDSWVAQGGHPLPAVVKLDIEGGEVRALPGMRKMLAQARPVIFLELHGHEAARVAWDELTGAGYILHRMQPGYPEVERLGDLDWKAYLLALPAERV